MARSGFTLTSPRCAHVVSSGFGGLQWCDQDRDDDDATRFDDERHSHHHTIRHHPATRVVTSNAVIAPPPCAARSLLLLSLTNVVASPSLLHRPASRRPLTLSRIASPRRPLSLTDTCRVVLPSLFTRRYLIGDTNEGVAGWPSAYVRSKRGALEPRARWRFGQPRRGVAARRDSGDLLDAGYLMAVRATARGARGEGDDDEKLWVDLFTVHE